MTEKQPDLLSLAKHASKGGEHIYTSPRDSNNHAANDAWHAAATPEVFMALHARIAELEAQPEAAGTDKAGQEPVAGQARFTGCEWSECAPEHVAVVLANPSEWPAYEVRYLYAEPAPGATAASPGQTTTSPTPKPPTEAAFFMPHRDTNDK